ncbi:MAG TPA: competence/damage-inducible protein A [Acidimicrobiales bacterium]|nr:competence/damage-inducible protein A [Acidimicrobiales bacterium]
MKCEVVAVGTELLLGQIVDTNSSWIGEQLALAGIDSHFQTKVGDNLERIVSAFELALSRSDAVIVCGGLGPTQDDITRDAIARVMGGVELVQDDAVLARIEQMFAARGRVMAANNARQAQVPVGARVIPQQPGTAPGLICPIGDKVLYAVPGVPREMKVMVEESIIPDLQARMGERAVIRSRVLRTWGLAESTLAETVAPRLDALEATGNPTIAFLASGIEGIKLRITAKAPTEEQAMALIEAEDAELRAILGTTVFGVDADTMERAAGYLLEQRGWTLGIAESMTGGLVASRVVDVPGSSGWFRGGIVAYDSQVKYDVLGVPDGMPVITAECAEAMADGVRKVVGSDVGLSVTGVAGPAEQEGQPVGTVWFGLALPDRPTESVHIRLPGQRDQIRQFATISLMDLLRRRLLEL